MENIEAKTPKAPTAVPTVEKAESKNNPNNKQGQDTSNDTNYKITESNDSKSDDKLIYNIKYPQISGLSDNEKQKKINSTLREEALKVLKYFEHPYGSLELNIDYEIVLKNTNILSIQYWGLGSVSNAAHHSKLFFTTNINIKTGEKLRLKDIVNIDKNFANKFLNGKFKALWAEQSDELRHFTNEEIQENFKDADSLDNIGTEKQSDVFSYFMHDSLGISIFVGFAIGGHAEFEIKYQDIKDNIKTENEIWKDLLNLSSVDRSDISENHSSSIKKTNGTSIPNSSPASATAILTQPSRSPSGDNIDTIDYNQFIKKVWVVKSWTEATGPYDYSSFLISKIENGKL